MGAQVSCQFSVADHPDSGVRTHGTQSRLQQREYRSRGHELRAASGMMAYMLILIISNVTLDSKRFKRYLFYVRDLFMPLNEGADRLHQEEETVCAGSGDLNLRGDHHHHGYERHPCGDEPGHRRLRGMLHNILLL